MRIEERVVGEGMLLTVQGDIVGGQCDGLADRIRALMDRKRGHVVLDLSQVRYVDSRGVGALVEALTVARNRAGSLRLVNVTWRVNEVLVVAGLSAILTESQPREVGLDDPVRPTTMH
jgi:anti-sigma B factor antagonist